MGTLHSFERTVISDCLSDERANVGRSLCAGANSNGEPQSGKRANAATEKGERGSPEQNEQHKGTRTAACPDADNRFGRACRSELSYEECIAKWKSSHPNSDSTTAAHVWEAARGQLKSQFNTHSFEAVLTEPGSCC